jgi:hypothetical protein
MLSTKVALKVCHSLRISPNTIFGLYMLAIVQSSTYSCVRISGCQGR